MGFRTSPTDWTFHHALLQAVDPHVYRGSYSLLIRDKNREEFILWKDFKEFAMKGNIIDLAVAVVIGGAFGKIVTSLVENIIMPLVGVLTGGIDLTKSFVYGSGEAQIQLGVFLQSIFNYCLCDFYGLTNYDQADT